MTGNNSQKLLRAVLSLPTAPFHEDFISAYVRNYSAKLGLKVSSDRYGNLKVVYQKGKGRTKVCFTAHMDHPGFEVTATKERSIKVRLLGGVNPKHFLGAKVLLVSKAGPSRGVVKKKLTQKFDGQHCFLIGLNGGSNLIRRGDFGYFDFPGYRFGQGRISSKAIDNVISTALLLDFLGQLKTGGFSAHVVCIFTRAEEVGLIGASGAIREKFLPRGVPIIVLEASSAKAGKVSIGGGPVIRVGDRYCSFSALLDIWVTRVASTLAKRKGSFQFQRALLPGGRCEASLYVEYGYMSGCLALPLGNYHNQGKNGPAPEYIDWQDYKRMLELLIALSQAAPVGPTLQQARTSVERRFARLKHLLL